MTRLPLLLLSAPLLAPLLAWAQTVPATQPVPQTDTSTVTADGTAHIMRVVPLSPVLSPEARAAYSKPGTDAPDMEPDVIKRRAGTQAWQDGAGKKSAAVYPVKITEGTVGGVPVHFVDPLPDAVTGPISGPGKELDPSHYSAVGNKATDSAILYEGHPIDPNVPVPSKRQGFPKAMSHASVHTDRVLMCIHGGGFNSDSGSLTESIPIANLTRTRVVSILYRLAPEHPYPAALDDAVAVYRELLKTYKPAHIAVYGTSAGAILTSEFAVRLQQLHLPEPAALGIFSALSDFYTGGDSGALFTLGGFTGTLTPPKPNLDHHSIDPEYTATANVQDPVLAPASADLHALPPALFLSSSRDFLLSGTTTLQRAWMRDGVPTQMVVFDGLPHAFWNDVSLPESREAYAAMARFFMDQLKQQSR